MDVAHSLIVRRKIWYHDVCLSSPSVKYLQILLEGRESFGFIQALTFLVNRFFNARTRVEENEAGERVQGKGNSDMTNGKRYKMRITRVADEAHKLLDSQRERERN